MDKLNKIKPDTILKNFWKNNDRFADLFNAFYIWLDIAQYGKDPCDP